MRYEQTEVQKEWLKKITHKKTGQRDLKSLVFNCFGRKLADYQVEALQGALNPENPEVLISFARQAGKTEVIGLIQALVPFFYQNINCYTFAPKIEQAQISYNRAYNFIKHNNYNIYDQAIIKDKADRLAFTSGVELRAVSASLNSEIEGLTCHIIILDESQRISSYKVREAIMPMGGATNAKVIKVGVPGVRGTHFHNSWNNKNYIKFIRPWKECLEIISEEYVLRQKQDPDTFATQYELLWNEASDTYISEELWRACERTDIYYNGLWVPYDFETQVGKFWGIDFAKKHDSTVITEGYYVSELDLLFITNWWELKGVNYTEQVGIITDIFHERKDIELIAYDQSAVGEAVGEMMDANGLPVQGYIFDMNTKDRLYKELRCRVQTNKLFYPTKAYFSQSSIRNQKAYKNFRQQTGDLEIEYKANGKMMVSHPQGAGYRDDYPDSLVLLNIAATDYVEPNCFLG